jgi:uncharacterized protein (UPF0332 family)
MTPLNREKIIARHMAKAAGALADAEANLAAGRFDDAASRAYYCCFHAARAALANVGVQPRTHRGVSERLNIDLVKPGTLEAEFLSILGSVQRDREIADYAIDAEVSPDDVRGDVAQARRFLERMQRLVASPA